MDNKLEKNIWKRESKRMAVYAVILCCMLLLCSSASSTAEAKTRAKFNTKKMTLSVGKSKSLKLKGTSKKAKWKVSTGKNNIRLSAKKKKSVKITGKRAGKAKVQAIIGSKKLVCKITVKNRKDYDDEEDYENNNQNNNEDKKEEDNAANIELVPEASVKVGDKITLQLSGNKNPAYWSSDKPECVHVEECDGNKVVLVGLNSATIKISAKIGKITKTCTLTIDEKYNYKLTPIMAPFNQYFYLETEDPDPYDLCFVDDSSIYFTSEDNNVQISPTTDTYCDVKYIDTEYHRVKGGYICSVEGFNRCDGGTLKMQRRLLYSYQDGYHEYTLNYNSDDYWNTGYMDTAISVECPAVKNYVQYLVDTYTQSGNGLFENLDLIYTQLNKLAIYPRSVLDASKPSEATPYPFLTSSPYKELGINTNIEMYEYMDGGLMAQALHPFVLDSLGFPGTIGEAAQIMDPSCIVESGSLHWDVVVTKDGESHTYGGAGAGGHDPILSSHANQDFLFDGSASDYATYATIDNLSDRLWEYAVIAAEEAKVYNDMLDGDIFDQTVGTGSWLRIGMEPYWLGSTPSTAYTYASKSWSGDSAYCRSNVWVDGRYINDYNIYEPGAKYEDHEIATIILRNQTYTTRNGDVKTGDIVYRYEHETDTWKAYTTYWDSNGYNSGDLPDQFVLTREEIAGMDLDCNTDIPPEHGLVYDSTQYPGTLF